MYVDSLMVREVHACDFDRSLDEAARLLWDHDLGAAPVVRGTKVIGVITDRDICMAAYTQGRPLREIPVQSAMSRALFVVHPHDLLTEAARVMRERRVRRLPVVDDEHRLLGVISLNDLVREAAAGGDVSTHEALATLAAVGEPRSPALVRLRARAT